MITQTPPAAMRKHGIHTRTSINRKSSSKLLMKNAAQTPGNNRMMPTTVMTNVRTNVHAAFRAESGAWGSGGRGVMPTSPLRGCQVCTNAGDPVVSVK